MRLSPEDVAAFADNQLDPLRHEEIAAAIADDPALEAKVRDHRALRAMLATHFAPIMTAHRLGQPDPPIESRGAMPRFVSSEPRQTRDISLRLWLTLAGLAVLLLLALLIPAIGAEEAYPGPVAGSELGQPL